MNLHVIYEQNAADIPFALRLLASDIEAGEVVAEGITIVVRESSGEIQVRGIGKTDSSRSFVDLHAGAAKLLR